ncbi:MAG: hypothetical protein H3C47_13105, partial [Candidatus Cloacimonetes bacterium]|nr:hypothetical protein [Candidatus Cloacimonadota bacterium]
MGFYLWLVLLLTTATRAMGLSPEVLQTPLGSGWHMVSPSIGKNTSVEQWLSNSGLSQINNLFVFREGAFHAWPESLATEHELPLLNFIEPGNALFLSLPSATIRTHDLRAVSRQNIAITTPGWHLVSPLIREPISPAQIIAQGIASNHPFTAIDRIFAY